VVRAIGHVWDGNEVWLLAAGAVLYSVFPRLYAASFRGFYLPLTMVVGFLILRGIFIEIRRHLENRNGQDFCDVIFGVSSILLALFFGIVVGNIVRGVPLDATGYFFEPIWATFRLGTQTAILDWYTGLAGIVALVTLAAHGSYYIALKTDEDLGRRARGFALLCWPVQFFLTFSASIATYFIRPEILKNYDQHKIGMLVPVAVVASLAIMLWAGAKGKEKLAFIASSLYITALLMGAAFALYPAMLPARDHQYDLTIYNTFAGNHGLSVASVGLMLTAVLAVACFVFAYRMSGGKVREIRN
jgi:cytochrome d ubiquinol oxidase subunit II